MIFFPASSASVIMRIWYASEFSNADVRPIHMAINLASSGVMLLVCTLSWIMTLLSFQMCVMAVADPDVLTLLSKITAISLDNFCVFLNARLSFNE